VQIGAEGEGHCTDVIEIDRPDDLGNIADLGLTLAETKLLLASVQQAIVRYRQVKPGEPLILKF
jgi:hypothetical protein